jgi:teichoic acid transport system permease protein
VSTRVTSAAQRSRLQSVGAVPPLHRYLAEAWRRRDLAISLSIADARSNHVDTVLGNVWQLLNPTLLVAVYYLIFGVIFDVTRGLDNYLGFLVIGVFLFSFTRKSASSGARAVINNRSLVQNIRFPRILLPASTVLTEFLVFLPSVVVILVVEFATGEPLTPAWLLLAPTLLLQLTFNLGLAMLVARATVHFRDMEQLLPFVLRLWFYMSGVLYPVTRIGEALGGTWQAIFEANPTFVYLTLGRQALMDGTTEPRLWLMGSAWAFGALLVGMVFFWRHELEYGDV